MIRFAKKAQNVHVISSAFEDRLDTLDGILRKMFQQKLDDKSNAVVPKMIVEVHDIASKCFDFLRPFMLRRLKNQVEKQLPYKQEKIIKLKLSQRQKRLYEVRILDLFFGFCVF